MAATERLSTTMDAELPAAVKRYAEAAGLDAASYVMAAVRRQMADDAVVAARFAEIDAANAEMESAALPPGESPLDVSEEEIAAAEAGIARALWGEEHDAA